MALRTDVGALPILEDGLPFVSEIEKVHACRQRWTYQHTHQRCARSFRDAEIARGQRVKFVLRLAAEGKLQRLRDCRV
jgi:hypothetical protein